MNIQVVIYNFKALQLQSDWEQQETFVHLYSSIKSLRQHSDIPIFIYYQSKVELDTYDYKEEYNVFFDFDNVKLRDCEDNLDRDFVKKENYQNMCLNYGNILVADPRTYFGLDPKQVFSNLDEGNWKSLDEKIQLISAENINSEEYNTLPEGYILIDSVSEKIEHNWQKCIWPESIISHSDLAETIAPSNFWNCHIKERSANSGKNICHFCCRIINE